MAELRTITVKIPTGVYQDFSKISEDLKMNFSESFVVLVTSYQSFPSEVENRSLKKELASMKKIFPTPRELRRPTSELSHRDTINIRRDDTEFLLTKSLSAINGGEHVFPLTKFFSYNPDRLFEVLKGVRIDGKLFDDLMREKILSQKSTASLADFIRLLDTANGSINVLGLRALHKLLVEFSSFLISSTRA